MRSTFLIGFLLCTVACVHSISRVDHFINKRAALPQVYQGPQGGNWNQSQQFQWVKVNNQWVRRDGTNKLPGYSQPNVPYNESAKWNTPSPSTSRPASPAQGPPSATNAGNQSRPGQQTQRQDSKGPVAWNPNADRALTEDHPKTTPRPATTTTTTTARAPQTQAPVHKPQGPTPTPARAPFGSGMGGQQKPNNNRYNPDASLTYGGLPGHRSTTKPTAPGKPGSNPWANL